MPIRRPAQAGRHDFGLDRRPPVLQYGIMLRSCSGAATELVRQPRCKGHPRSSTTRPVRCRSSSARREHRWLVAIAMGLAHAVMRGTFESTVAHDPRADRASRCPSSGWARSSTREQSRLHSERSGVPRARLHAESRRIRGQWFLHCCSPRRRLGLYIGFSGRAFLRSSLIEAPERGLRAAPRAPRALTERRVAVPHVLRTSMITFVSPSAYRLGALVAGARC